MLRIGLGLALVLAGQASAQDLCAKVAPAMPGAACVNTAHGAALAQDPARAAQLAAYADAGEQRFQTHFGRPATPYVVYQMTDMDHARTVNTALRDLGVKRILPWVSRETQRETITKALHEVTVPRMKADGRSDAMIDTFVSRRLADMDNDIDQREAGVVPHELAHQWYVEAGWPGVPGDARGHYGGPGPDWMDELAAILAETPAAGDRRREQFKALYQNTRPGASQAELLDLSALLDQEHPEHARRKAAGEKPVEGVAVRVVSAPSGFANAANLFYLRNRVVADFLIAQTGDPAVFGSILDGFRRGQTFDQWLATEGAGRGLAADRAGLERQWRAWLVSRWGEPQIA